MELEQCQERVELATHAFHFNLHCLLHRQGMFQLLQHYLPNNIHEFMENHHELLRMHEAFAASHKELLDAHVALVLANQNTVRIPSPPKIVRQTAQDYITPLKPPSHRALFTDLTYSESSEDKE
jgi:hypothetical protein